MDPQDNNSFTNSEYDVEDDTRFDIRLIDESRHDDYTGHGATLKSSFIVKGTDLGGGEQPPSIIDENISGGEFTVQCDLAQVIHGTTVEGGTPATLMVFQFAFVPRGNRRRFEEAEVTISFSAGNVHSITPNKRHATLLSQKQRELSHSVNPSLEAAFGPAKATAGYTWELKETSVIERYSSIVGIIQQQGQNASTTRARKNTVFWGFYENTATSSGIPSFIQTAVLVKREATSAEPAGEKFSADITIHGKVHNCKVVKDKLMELRQKMLGEKTKAAKVIFDPKKTRGKVDDINNLTNVNLDTYKQLVTFRLWADGAESHTAEKPAVLDEETEERPAMTAASDTATVGPVIEAERGPPVQLVEASHLSEQTRQPHIEAPAFMMKNPTVCEPVPQEGSNRIISQHNEEKHQKLNDLREKLLLVRKEAELLTELVSLVREERTLVQRIMDLGD
ncbi:hypothetical protein F4859DRAFT_507736 [Xylaria cf. heliscus]|nr:hypothetical protein F4859DRAFT_507736 [Xylaria cf. heliscus]